MAPEVVVLLVTCSSLLLIELTSGEFNSILNDESSNKIDPAQNIKTGETNVVPELKDFTYSADKLNPRDFGVGYFPPLKFDDPAWPKSDLEIPEMFDARHFWEKWCPRIGEPEDEGSCGVSWAVAPASAASDRHCIASRGRFQTRLSAQDVMSCCENCALDQNKCIGGEAYEAWSMFWTRGVVTGGAYASFEGCQPYHVPPCLHHEPKPNEYVPLHKCTPYLDYRPACFRQCTNTLYKNTYELDIVRNKNSYYLMGEKHIQKDIMTHGPLTTTLLVYEDFPNYTSGVYQRNSTRQVAKQDVKIIGWGTREGVPYWLVANSWNKYWGENGFFKILRGYNHCQIESYAYGGEPELR